MIIGKGPTSRFHSRVSIRDFNVVALNHAVRLGPVDFAHAIDIDVLDDCGDAMLTNARWLLMPRHPHVRHKASGLTIHDFLDTCPVLRRFHDDGRLVVYDLWSGSPYSGSRGVPGTFSASAVINLLARCDVRNIRLLGVDGGKSYFKVFSDSTLLANGHASYDIQFDEIRRTARDYDMTVQPLFEPVRIFVGCDDSQLVAGHVLEHSIRKHASVPVEMFFMNNMPIKPPRHARNRPGTGFSFNRFLIPKLAGYHGKAIYLDADMLVFDDIAKLWSIPFEGRKVLCSVQHEMPRGWENKQNNPLGEGRYWTPGRQMSVMLMDCDRLDWNIDKIIEALDAGQYSYKNLMAEFCILRPEEIGDTIANTWNCLEWYEPGRSQLVHFTVVPTQPWKNDRNALTELWHQAFAEAVRDGAVPMDVIRSSVEKRYIKPALLAIAETAAASPTRTADRAATGPESESSRLRRMLWDVMVSDYRNREDADRVGARIGRALETLAFRKPISALKRLRNAVMRPRG